MGFVAVVFTLLAHLLNSLSALSSPSQNATPANPSCLIICIHNKTEFTFTTILVSILSTDLYLSLAHDTLKPFGVTCCVVAVKLSRTSHKAIMDIGEAQHINVRLPSTRFSGLFHFERKDKPQDECTLNVNISPFQALSWAELTR